MDSSDQRVYMSGRRGVLLQSELGGCDDKRGKHGQTRKRGGKLHGGGIPIS